MFVAASSRCFADLPFAEACQQLTELEYDKVEIWMSTAGSHLNPDEVASDPERFVNQYRELTRLTPIAFCLEEDASVETVRSISKAAKLLRVAQLSVPSSPLGTPFNTEVDRLRDFVDTTGRDGVRLSIKTATGRLTEDPRTAVELCQAVKGLGLTYDPSYYICGPHRDQPHDKLFPYVYHCHLRDTTPEQLQVQIGLGEIDYNRLISQLEREGYQSALSVELLPEQMDTAIRPLEMRKLRMLLETLL